MPKSLVFNALTGQFDVISEVDLTTVGSSPNSSGATLTSDQVLTLQPADNTNPGLILASAQSIGGDKTFSGVIYASGGVDVPTTGGTDTLSIGAVGADIINIGNSGATVNIQGTTLYENVTQLLVSDPVITLNVGGGPGSAAGSGIELEENSIITGYAQTSLDRNSWQLKAPNTAGIATITAGAGGITLNQSSHDPVTLGTANGLSLATQQLSLGLSSTSTTGALSSTDWNTFNNKQAAGNYITDLTGDVAATGPGSVAATIANNAVTNAKLADMPANTIKGNNTGAPADPIDLTTAQTTAMLNNFVGDSGAGGVKGLVPAPAAGDAAASKFLKADGTWSTAGTASPLTTKGDIYGYSTVNDRIPVGVDGQDLIADSNQALGVRYADSVVKNYARINSDADVSIGNWVTFADAASNIPADGTGGSPSITWTRTTSSPLEGPGSFLFSKAGSANYQGQGASLAFSLSNACQGQINAVTFDFKVVSGTFTAGNGITAPLNDGTTTTNAGNSDIEVFMYDVTNSVLIPVTPQTITSNSTISWQFKGTFQAPSNSTSYRLIIYQATATTNDYTLQFDNFFVGRQAVSYGYAGTDGQPYTPTYTGVGTVSTNSAFWRKSGDFVEAWGFVTLGTVAGSLFSITLPPSLALDTTKLGANNTTSNPGQLVGTLGDSSGSQSSGIYLVTATGTSTALIYAGHRIGINNTLITPQNANSLFSNGDVVSWSFRVPVAGWSSNVLMSNDANTRVVAAEATGTPSSTTSANIIILGTTTFDTHGSYNSSTGRYTVPVSGFYRVTAFVNSTNAYTIQVYKNGVLTLAIGSTNDSGSTAGIGQGSGVVQCVAGDLLDIRPSATTGGFGGGSNFCFEKISGPASIAASENVFLQYTGNAGGSLTANVTNVDFTTKVVDSASAWSGTIFTAPRAGWYTLTGAILQNAGGTQNYYIWINGVQKFSVANVASSGQKNISGGAYLLAGDQLSLRPDSAVTLANSATAHWLSITSQ